MTVFGNSLSSKRGLAALLGALSLYASGAHGADADWTDTIRYQGFIGQGLVGVTTTMCSVRAPTAVSIFARSG